MGTLNSLAFSEAIAASGVEGIVDAADYFPSPHPIEELLKLAAESLPCPLQVLVTENGAPFHFFLTGFEFLPVIFSARYVGLVDKLQRLLSPLFYGHGGRRRETEVLALETIAEFCLLDRKIDQAAVFFMKSRLVATNLILIDVRSAFGIGADIWFVDNAAGVADELYINKLLFGLAHEIGHAMETTGAGGLRAMPWCSDALIRTHIETCAARATGDAALSYHGYGPTAMLAVDRLRREAGADIEGCRLVAKATGPILARYGAPGAAFDLARLIESFLIGFMALGFISGCRRIPKLMGLHTDKPGGHARAVELLQQPLLFAARQLIVRDHLPIIAFEATSPGAGPVLARFWGDAEPDVERLDPAFRDMFNRMWASASEANAGAFLEIDEGLLAAMELWQSNDSQIAQLLVDYAAIHRERPGDTDGAIERFLNLAVSMGLSLAHVKRLAELLGY
jgi:hypothetical protein